ncbi:protein SCAR3-like [Cynara cardunculus var. scolymus]|nr:protein SCAR3-like [Cynara cardunculus var. scolymus]
MDSYEGCHNPPRLQKLDKFDTNVRGSCSKRYSDPTYFRRASAGPRGTHLQSGQGEKKAQRSKKKRSLARHRDMTHDAPTFMHDGGMDLPSRNYTGKTSQSLDVPTIHVASKSGTEPKEPKMEDHLTCFDSRNGSGFIECIFHPRYSTQSEENETKEMSSDLKEQQNAYLDLAPFHEKNEVSDETVENSSNSQEGSAPRWSFVTWDEKLEIVESTQIFCTENKLDAKESEESSTRIDLIDFDFHDDHLALSVTPNEIEGDMHYYMGALNIIASGSETDVCCQTKREVKQYSGLNNEDVDEKLKESNLDDRSMNFEFHVPESTYTRAMSCKQISHESHIKAQRISNSKSDLLENSDEVAGTSLISLTCTDNELLCSSSRLDSSSEQMLTKKPSGPHTNPIIFWTNGGLLGLAPSKPPDFGAVEDDKQVARADNSLDHFCNASSITRSDGPIGKSFGEQFGDGCSPPVEHMRRISLEAMAMDGCKLKLMMCNWHGSSSVDMFELAHDESETDSDNTFYRYPEYASSDDYHSELNSEQWDSPTGWN